MRELVPPVLAPTPSVPGQVPARVLELLRSELSSGAEGRLLVVPPSLAAWGESCGAPALDARPMVWSGDSVAALAGCGTLDAVISVLADDTPACARIPCGELAGALRRALRDGGRALVATSRPAVGPDSSREPPPYERLLAALAEHRLLIRRELRADGSTLPWDGHRWTGARRTAPEAIGDPRSGGPPPRAASIVVAQAHSITVRGYRAGDEEALIELFRRCFHADRSLAHWRWKFEDNPYGRHRISLAADEAGRPIAQYAAYPCLWWEREGRRYLHAHQIADIMSAPEVRGRGRGQTSMLAQSARHFYSAHCWGRVAFNYGFHTSHSRRFSRRFLGVVDAEPVPFRWLQPEAATPPRSKGFRIRPLTEAGPELDALWRRAKGGYGRLAVRDRRHVDWRYFQRPDVEYLVLGVFRWRRLVGWSVFRRRDGQIAWVDAFFERRAAPAAGLTVEAAQERLGAGSRISGWFAPRPSWWHRELDRLGFVEEPEPDDLALGFLSFSGPADAEAFRRDLYYTMGDSDLF